MKSMRSQGILTAVSILVVCLAAGNAWAQDEEEIPYVKAAEIKAWDALGTKYVVLDIRDSEEAKDYGHVPGSLNVPMWIQQENGPPTIDPAFDENLKKQIPADSKIVLLAENGWMGQRSFPHIKELGYEHIHVFENGIVGNRPTRISTEFKPGWMASDLPWVEGTKSYDRYSTDEKITEVDAETMRKWIENREKFIIIDVRSERELTQYGRPAHSVNIPLYKMVEKDGKMTNEFDPEFTAKVKERAKGYDKVITICTLSWRAGMAADRLQQAGMDNVYVFHHGIQGRVDGHGITKGWRAHGLPYFEAKPEK